jgi:hypothetical protein
MPLAYWLGMFYNTPPSKERPGSRQRDPAKATAPKEEPGSQQKDPTQARALEEEPRGRQRDPAKGKWPEEVWPKKKP